ncbi:hypothetical protein [Massilia sp. erpn]|uniref:hypothetical protein n=1 Tax=Massilia sp. erpn TaxID=2738142 RepID=UPI0021052575|nr:hypothetical protein [Massilia sp. erpn]UTY55877.1 hypothetical protein HPQ68_00950 [Massilia sp. erpn]
MSGRKLSRRRPKPLYCAVKLPLLAIGLAALCLTSNLVGIIQTVLAATEAAAAAVQQVIQQQARQQPDNESPSP